MKRVKGAASRLGRRDAGVMGKMPVRRGIVHPADILFGAALQLPPAGVVITSGGGYHRLLTPWDGIRRPGAVVSWS